VDALGGLSVTGSDSARGGVAVCAAGLNGMPGTVLCAFMAGMARPGATGGDTSQEISRARHVAEEPWEPMVEVL
jgi:hypothetical protein